MGGVRLGLLPLLLLLLLKVLLVVLLRVDDNGGGGVIIRRLLGDSKLIIEGEFIDNDDSLSSDE